MGLNGGEFVIIAVIALLVIGPERLPQYASQLARLVRELRRMATGAREQVRAELGPEFDDVDWQKLDPRQYDPRRIVREALQEAWDDPDDDAPVSTTRSSAAADTNLKKASRPAGRPGGGASRPGDTTGPAPFDTDAT
jgi:sec-independent protein translocase protein TatB